MKKPIKIIAIIAAAYLVIYFSIRMINKSKWLKYLESLGMNIAQNFSYSELKTSYEFLYDYARKYSGNAWAILKATNPSLYVKAIAIANKYKIFNAPAQTETVENSGTNIPNIVLPTSDIPIDSPVVTAGNPDTSGGNIVPPTINLF